MGLRSGGSARGRLGARCVRRLRGGTIAAAAAAGLSALLAAAAAACVRQQRSSSAPAHDRCAQRDDAFAQVSPLF